MDYNDVQTRLEMIYASIGEQFTYGQAALETTHIELKSEGKERSVSISFFNPNDKSKILNQINSIISNLANLKDCLKRKIGQQDRDPKIIEDEINDSPELQIILDLSNQAKHEYPLRRTRRSGKDPLIQNVGRVLSPSNKPDNIRHQKNDGSAMMNMMVRMTADITDSKGNLLYHLNDLVEGALGAWEQIIKKYGI
mgnify:CR=1 FL=1